MAVRSKGDLKRKIEFHIKAEKNGVSADRLASLLGIKKRERARFLITLAKMEQDGDISKDKRGKYSISLSNAVRAKLVALQQVYGFARPDTGDDIFIPGRNLNGALPGDTLLINIEEGDSRGPNGTVMQVIEKGGRLYTGRLTDEGGFKLIVPDAFIRFNLPIKKQKDIAAKVGDKVRFEAEYNRNGELFANIISTYGSADSAKVCADAIVDAAGIPNEFSLDVLEQAETLAVSGITEKDIAGRDDLRELTVFTIDGSDAKDLDDAVSLEETDSGWRLGVHIADVSHYVVENTPLDGQARLRGTSVYFADRVIPMLPEGISNGICSLNAGQDRLALSAILTLDKSGVLTDTLIRKTVIRSCLRGVYSEVNALFDGSAGQEIIQKYASVRPTLEAMRNLADKFDKAAAGRGTMELVSSEPVFVLDEQGHPIDIDKRIMGESEGIIEQFMIAANVAVAEYARKLGIPFVYRIHEQPDPKKLELLAETARRLGFKTLEYKSTGDLRKLMEEARETPYARLISDRVLRSMAKARYSHSPAGHYGLSLKDYCHFTAPIRRYSDLSIHRILTAILSGINKNETVRRYSSFVIESSELSSQYEIRAMTAERECEACYMAEYMGRFIGDEFDGIISSVSFFGLFVELPNSVEGLVHIDSLPESELSYDEVASLTDRRGRPVYTVGDEIRVRVVSTDVSAGQIDFIPANGN
ncbi:MAG: ribonuclease R [Oscillospiraceae bacterium]|nr:ribonuclease R [Oscillospiraceae bacterium]MDD4414591.1 ribonuclease R [Oscillospiraceae bacterium]